MEDKARRNASSSGDGQALAPFGSDPVVENLVAPSLLNVQRTRLEEEGYDIRFTRLLFIASFSVESEVASSYMEQLMLSRTDERHTNGLCLVQRRTLINFVETVDFASMRLMQKLKTDGDKCVLDSVRIVAYNSDCPPSKSFQNWNSCVVNLPKETNVDLDSESLSSAAHEMYAGILSIGRQMRSSGAGDDGGRTDDKSIKAYSHLLPSQDRLLAFMQHTRIMSLDDFIDVFATPVSIDLISDSVWPTPKGATVGWA